METEELEMAVNDLKKARKLSWQSQCISLLAITLSAIALIIRLVAVLR